MIHYFYFLISFQATYDDSYNKLALRVNSYLWFELFARQDFNERPFMNFLEGGLSFPGRNLYGKCNITAKLSQIEEYEGEIYFQWKKNQTLHTTFEVSQSGTFTGYVFSSLTKITNRNPIALSGSLKVEAQRKSSSFDLTFDGSENNANVKYGGRISFMSNETEKIVYINMKSKQNIYLNIHYQKEFDHLKIDFMWDKDKNPSKRIYFDFSADDDVVLDLIVLSFQFKIQISTRNSSTKLFISFGDKSINLDSKLKLGFEVIEILFSFESSFLSTKKWKVHFKCNQNYNMGVKELYLLVSD